MYDVNRAPPRVIGNLINYARTDTFTIVNNSIWKCQNENSIFAVLVKSSEFLMNYGKL